MFLQNNSIAVALLIVFLLGVGLAGLAGCNDVENQPKIIKRPASPPPPGFDGFRPMDSDATSGNDSFGGQLATAVSLANLEVGSGMPLNYSLFGTQASFGLRQSIGVLLTISQNDDSDWRKAAVSLGYEAVEFADGFDSYQDIAHIDLNLIQRSLIYQTIAFAQLGYREDARAALTKAIELGAYDFELLSPYPNLLEFAQRNFDDQINSNLATNFDLDIADAINIGKSFNRDARVIQLIDLMQLNNVDSMSIVFVAADSLPEVRFAYNNLVEAVKKLEFDVPPSCFVIDLKNDWFDNQQPNDFFNSTSVEDINLRERDIVQNILKRDVGAVLVFSEEDQLVGFARSCHSTKFFSSLINEIQNITSGTNTQNNKVSRLLSE